MAKRGGKSAAIKRSTDGYWEWFVKKEKPPYKIGGKYLFFSANRRLLVKIAIAELTTGGYHEAKVPMEGNNLSPEYVLCLYYKDDSRRLDLAARYKNYPGLAYRYWKSDEATQEGQYSTEFLSRLSSGTLSPRSKGR